MDETITPQIPKENTQAPQVQEETAFAAPSNTNSTDIVLNRQTVTFPCSVSDLVALGMTMNEEIQINPGDFEVIVGNMGGEDDFYLTAYNDTADMISSNDAVVKTIGYDAYLVENPVNYSVCRIKIGMSMDDVEAILGKPIGLYTGTSGYVSKDYTVNDYEISIGYNDSIATSIDISV